MKLLLTNDDGIDAPGLAALTEAARQLGQPIVVAPFECHSGCGHRVTVDRPLRLELREPGRHALSGTPADCVRVALHELKHEPVCVLAGVNNGGNLGADVWYSGTVAAVREAALHGFPGIALSHYIRRGMTVDWNVVVRWITPLLRRLLAEPCEPGTFWNVNLPHLDLGASDPEVVFCPLDVGPLPVGYRTTVDGLHYAGNYHQRLRRPGADVDVCFGGKIAVTRLQLGG